MSVLLIIPTRFASSRFPGKAMAMLRGVTGEEKTLTHRCFEAALEVDGVDEILVACDDERIAEEARRAGAIVKMTDPTCANGTERCASVLPLLDKDPEIVVNLQGDAPLTPPWFLSALVGVLRADPSIDCATPVLRSEGAMLGRLREDRAAGRIGATTAVIGAEGRALYFSKEILPFGDKAEVFHHVGAYAYRPDALRRYAELPMGNLEESEGLEQLRFLENGLRVQCVEVDAKDREFWELNNPEDVPRIEAILRDQSIN